MGIPAHVAIIMDGNGRWARRRRRPRHVGHQAGEKATQATIEACANRGVKVLTLFAFSSENWSRPRTEISKLMDLFMDALSRRMDALHENHLRICFIGDRSRFSKKLQKEMASAEALTRDNTRMRVNVAVSYGGRWEIVEAARGLVSDALAGTLSLDEIDERIFESKLCIPEDVPEPDLFIRTGGERRLSNFLLWHLAYTELYFTDILWPDFDAVELDAAIDWFNGRERRFGAVNDA